MKMTAWVLLVLTFLSGCASTDKNYLAMLTAAQAMAVSRSAAETAKFQAMADIAKNSTDPSAKVAAVMAMSMQTTPEVRLPNPPEDQFYKWASVLIGPIAAIFPAYYSYKLGVASSNNQTTQAVEGYRTFGAMGLSIERAGTAGYPYVQAPGTTTTTTNTLSGQGVIGSGTYTGPVTRNCNSGNAAPGGSGGTTGGTGAPSGAATC